MPTLDDLYKRVIRDTEGHWIPRGRSIRLRKLRVACWHACGGHLGAPFDLTPKCRQPRCCAPDHQRVVPLKVPADLTADDIEKILADDRISREVAEDFNCAPSTVRMIRAGHRHKDQAA